MQTKQVFFLLTAVSNPLTWFENKIPHFFRIFEMAAMPFPCYGIWVDLGNLPWILPRYYFIYARFPILFF